MVFSWLWRLSLLLLPWQIRWFSGASLAGWPWEQGTWSIVLSMLFMLGTVIWVFVFCRPEWNEVKRNVVEGSSVSRRSLRFASTSVEMKLGILVFLVLSSFVVSWGNILALRAICFWWFSVLLLVGFIWSLVKMKVQKTDVLWMFFWSLIPHALLGIWQYADQFVFGSKWLGMAVQDPRMLGVSVVEHGEFRLLRAYGGFPHPNIFGGWLAVGLLNVLALSRDVYKKNQALILVFGSVLMSIAFILSYSRSAWIAFVIGLVMYLGRSFWKKQALTQFFWLVLFAIVLSGAIVSGSQWSHIASRFQTETRLEQKSVSERVTNLKDAGQLFLRRPWFGYGPNAEMLSLVTTEKAEAPLQPPHNIFVLFILDFGLIGSLVVVWLVFRLRKLFANGSFFSWFVACVALGLFDHYLWSHWAGRCLFMLVCLFCFLPRTQMPEED